MVYFAKAKKPKTGLSGGRVSQPLIWMLLFLGAPLAVLVAVTLLSYLALLPLCWLLGGH